eukprot:CAMPEP_0174895380 /NCGR_PEP_ID=MMETSP0167-20121228/9809_1 /TAXON_ID=38298 /ORGANISM="Rhodella maculata, Strain CCMP736" /LENGTH=286 /DNA_ID=CAMNT_0016134697 /DNA_START=103 /DNA_END=963 /DNA_ORIENTATION=+
MASLLPKPSSNMLGKPAPTVEELLKLDPYFPDRPLLLDPFALLHNSIRDQLHDLRTMQTILSSHVDAEEISQAVVVAFRDWMKAFAGFVGVLMRVDEEILVPWVTMDPGVTGTLKAGRGRVVTAMGAAVEAMSCSLDRFRKGLTGLNRQVTGIVEEVCRYFDLENRTVEPLLKKAELVVGKKAGSGVADRIEVEKRMVKAVMAVCEEKRSFVYLVMMYRWNAVPMYRRMWLKSRAGMFAPRKEVKWNSEYENSKLKSDYDFVCKNIPASVHAAPVPKKEKAKYGYD